jgi:hypothetical protein
MTREAAGPGHYGRGRGSVVAVAACGSTGFAVPLGALLVPAIFAIASI